MKAKQFIRILCVAIPAMFALSSCNANGKYVAYNGTVAHSYWTFSFGTVYHELPDVDPDSFESLENWLGRDKSHAYFRDKIIDNANPSTLKAEHFPLSCDRKDYYFEAKALRVADMKSFKVLKWYDTSMWARDNRYAYYDSIRIDTPDIESFRVVSHCVAVDSKNVYRYGKILPLADPATYQESWKGFYSRDKAHIWYLGTLLEDADYASFVVDSDNAAHDSRGSFDGADRTKAAPPAE